jgi:hypothetical protein
MLRLLPLLFLPHSGDPHFQSFRGGNFDFQQLGLVNLVYSQCYGLSMHAWQCNFGGSGRYKVNTAFAFTLNRIHFEMFAPKQSFMDGLQASSFGPVWPDMKGIHVVFSHDESIRSFTWGGVQITIMAHLNDRAAFGYYLDVSIVTLTSPNSTRCSETLIGLCHDNVFHSNAGSGNFHSENILANLLNIQLRSESCLAGGVATPGQFVDAGCTNPLDCCAMEVHDVQTLCAAVACHPQLHASCMYSIPLSQVL